LPSEGAEERKVAETSGVLTVYLDQNKWIDLAKAIYRPDAKAAERDNAEKLNVRLSVPRMLCHDQSLLR
jgi:hypothetical protein